MRSAAPTNHFKITRKNYGSLIDAVLADLAAKNAAPVRAVKAARTAYLKTAIAKGTPFAELASGIADLNAEQLAEAAQKLPDKQAQGWTGIASLSEANRELFAEAASNRSDKTKAMLAKLFPEGKTDIILTLAEKQNSLGNRIADFIDTHNARAKEAFAAQYAEDLAAAAKNPQAGKKLDQKQIRRDPSDPTKLQVFKPCIRDGEPVWHPTEANGWQPGPRLGKVLQDEYEWDLYEIFLRETNAGNKGQKQAKDIRAAFKATLKEIATRTQKKADRIDPECLRVLISCDPQKIGEMSTGQDWASCTASDGPNFGYVMEDIAAGTLVAYVIHKNDTEGRYPLMRILLKPFHNDKGETIYVPAKNYGGSNADNEVTNAAFLATLHNFIFRQNDGKSGEFRMNDRLYTDGQATRVTINGDWKIDSLSKAIRDYQEGALKEFITELNENEDRLAEGRRGLHNEDPAENIKKLKKSIRRLFNMQDKVNGLARMYFREQARTSMGFLPAPEDLIKAIASKGTLLAEGNAIEALSKGNYEEWKRISETIWTPWGQKIIARAFLLSSENDSKESLLAATKAYIDARTSEDGGLPDLGKYGLLDCLNEVRALREGNFDTGDTKRIFYAVLRQCPEIADRDCLMTVMNMSSERCVKAIAKGQPELIRQIFEESEANASSQKHLHTIGALGEYLPEYAGKAYAIFEEILENKIAKNSACATENLGSLITAHPHIATARGIELIVENAIGSEDLNGRIILQMALNERPDMATKEAFAIARNAAETAPTTELKSLAYRTATTILDINASLADTSYFETLRQHIASEDTPEQLRCEALRNIGTIASSRKEFATLDLLEDLIALSIDACNVTLGRFAKNAVEKILKGNIEISPSIPLTELIRLEREGKGNQGITARGILNAVRAARFSLEEETPEKPSARSIASSSRYASCSY